VLAGDTTRLAVNVKLLGAAPVSRNHAGSY
jgi:hypothetical protein